MSELWSLQLLELSNNTPLEAYRIPFCWYFAYVTANKVGNAFVKDRIDRWLHYKKFHPTSQKERAEKKGTYGDNPARRVYKFKFEIWNPLNQYLLQVTSKTACGNSNFEFINRMHGCMVWECIHVVWDLDGMEKHIHGVRWHGAWILGICEPYNGCLLL